MQSLNATQSIHIIFRGGFKPEEKYKYVNNSTTIYIHILYIHQISQFGIKSSQFYLYRSRQTLHFSLKTLRASIWKRKDWSENPGMRKEQEEKMSCLDKIL